MSRIFSVFYQPNYRRSKHRTFVYHAADREDEAEAAAESLYRDYMSSPRYVDFLTYVIAETYEKLSWDADADEVREIKESLAKFKDYKYYVPLNNNSALIIIPHI